jgi:hypothetical protein
MENMTSHAYLLLDIAEDKIEKAVKELLNNAGIMRIDILEGSPNALITLEASAQKRLSELTLRAFALVKEFTNQVHLLPVKEKYAVAAYSKNTRRKKKEGIRKAV